DADDFVSGVTDVRSMRPIESVAIMSALDLPQIRDCPQNIPIKAARRFSKRGLMRSQPEMRQENDVVVRKARSLSLRPCRSICRKDINRDECELDAAVRLTENNFLGPRLNICDAGKSRIRTQHWADVYLPVLVRQKRGLVI